MDSDISGTGRSLRDDACQGWRMVLAVAHVGCAGVTVASGLDLAHVGVNSSERHPGGLRYNTSRRTTKVDAISWAKEHVHKGTREVRYGVVAEVSTGRERAASRVSVLSRLAAPEDAHHDSQRKIPPQLLSAAAT